jgi:hypothetical protein
MTTSQPDPGELTRLTTDEERDRISGIALDDADVAHVLDLVGKGLISAAQKHENAVQDNFGLRATVTVSLGRLVGDADGQPVPLEGAETIEADVRGRKNYKDGAAPIEP